VVEISIVGEAGRVGCAAHFSVTQRSPMYMYCRLKVMSECVWSVATSQLFSLSTADDGLAPI